MLHCLFFSFTQFVILENQSILNVALLGVKGLIKLVGSGLASTSVLEIKLAESFSYSSHQFSAIVLQQLEYSYSIKYS